MTKLLIALTVVTILAAMAAAGTVKPRFSSTVGAAPAPPAVTISVEELHRGVDVHKLPVLEIDNLY